MTGSQSSLASALLAFQAEAPTLPKNATNPHFKSKFTPLDTIVETIKPLLVKHGLVWTTSPGTDAEGRPALDYKLIHAGSGEALSGQMPLLPGKGDMQGLGSALTYGRRYAVTCVLDLVSDEDDDGNAAQNSQRKKPQPQRNDVASPAVRQLSAAAKGLKVAQVKGAFAAVGLTAPEPFPADHVLVFAGVPADKVDALTKALEGIAR